MTKQGLMVIGASLAALTFSTAAVAQDSVPIRVTFTGTVTTSAQSSVMVRQPDGSMGPYSGVTPAYNYQANDPVSISFETQMPSQAFLTANPQLLAADGTYRVPATFSSPGIQTFGQVNPSNFDISGPIGIVPTSQPSGLGGITLIYDSNSGQFSMEMPNGRWAFAAADGPSYDYNFATNTLTASGSTCLNNSCAQGTGLTARGTETTVSYRGTVVGAPERAGGQEYAAGFWDMLWSGSWNLPTYGSGASSGGATQVPEPSVIVLFGSAAAGLMFARRRKRKAA